MKTNIPWKGSVFAVLALCALLTGCNSKPTPTSGPAPAANPAPVPATIPASVSSPDELDTAIREVSDYLNRNIPKGNKVVFLNIRSDYPDLSEYILSGISENAVNSRVFSVVDRREIDTIRSELDFQYSGDVSDDSAQAIGRMLGAQTIVSGTANKFGSLYRIQVKAIEVQSAAVQGQWNKNVPDGVTIAALTERYVPAGTVAARPAQGSARTAQTAQTQAPAASTGTAQTVQAPADPPAPTIYKIGDKGPAGGLIFYDKGNREGGWQYMEVSATSLGTAQWGMKGTSVTTSAAIGMGRRNTLLIVDVLRGKGESGRAAQLCVEYRGGGFSDWFLPSKDELNAVYTSLVKSYLVIDQGLTGWTDWYWSSSEVTGSYSWLQRFSDGYQNHDGDYTNSNNRRDNVHSVRAVRQF